MPCVFELERHVICAFGTEETQIFSIAIGGGLVSAREMGRKKKLIEMAKHRPNKKKRSELLSASHLSMHPFLLRFPSRPDRSSFFAFFTILLSVSCKALFLNKKNTDSILHPSLTTTDAECF